MTTSHTKLLGRTRRMFLTALVIGFPSFAAAQTTVTGGVTATFDGEERTWYILEHQSDARSQSSANMMVMDTFSGPVYTVDIQAHPEERFSVEGALHISGMLDSIEGCPCALTLTDALYWTTSSMFNEVYQAVESEMTVETVEEVGEGVFRLTGSFSARLGFVESAMQGDPDTGRTVTIAGTFVADRVLVGE